MLFLSKIRSVPKAPHLLPHHLFGRDYDSLTSYVVRKVGDKKEGYPGLILQLS